MGGWDLKWCSGGYAGEKEKRQKWYECDRLSFSFRMEPVWRYFGEYSESWVDDGGAVNKACG